MVEICVPGIKMVRHLSRRRRTESTSEGMYYTIYERGIHYPGGIRSYHDVIMQLQSYYNHCRVS
jgi:hypothetical protein